MGLLNWFRKRPFGLPDNLSQQQRKELREIVEQVPPASEPPAPTENPRAEAFKRGSRPESGHHR